MSNQSRQPRGTPVGGQFAGKTNPECDFVLEPHWPGFTRQIETANDIRVESWIDADGRLQDPPDGSPAVRWFHPNGSIECEGHCQDGRPQDPDDVTPAVRRFYPDGTVANESHYQDDLQIS